MYFFWRFVPRVKVAASHLDARDVCFTSQTFRARDPQPSEVAVDACRAVQEVLTQRTESFAVEKNKLAALKKALEKRKKPMQNKQNQMLKLREDVRCCTICCL